MAGSSWRREPAAALRGLAKVSLAARRLLVVEALEGGAAHIDLATYLEGIGEALAI